MDKLPQIDVSDWGKKAKNPEKAQDFLRNKIKEFTGEFSGHAAGEMMNRNKTIEGYKKFDDGKGLQLVRKPRDEE